MRIILAMLLLLSTSLLGQTIPLADVSPSDSPVTLKGTITFNPKDQNDITCSLIGHNNTNRMIVAYRMYFNVVRPDGESIEMRHTHDHFFKDHALMVNLPQPQSDYLPNDIDCQAFFSAGQAAGSARPPDAVPSRPPEAHVRTVFVQFDDGSTWGDDKAVQEIMFDRNEALAYLQSLKDANDLGQALAVYVPLRGADHKIRSMRKGKQVELQNLHDIRAAAAEIDKDLAIAQSHPAWLK